MCIPRATVSAVSCLVVPAFICIDLLISRVLKINDDDDDDEICKYITKRGDWDLMVAGVCCEVENQNLDNN